MVILNHEICANLSHDARAVAVYVPLTAIGLLDYLETKLQKKV